MRKYPNFLFKIQRVSDGRHSTGGFPPNFTPMGKIWKTHGYLIRHLKDLGVDKMHEVYAGCRLVIFSEHMGEDAFTLDEVFYELTTEEIFKRLNGK